MNQPHLVPGPSLELIFETIHGFQRTSALKAALELDVFTGLTQGKLRFDAKELRKFRRKFPLSIIGLGSSSMKSTLSSLVWRVLSSEIAGSSHLRKFFFSHSL